MPLLAILLLIQVMPVGAVAGSELSLSSGQELTALIEKIEAAYAQVGGYQAETEIREYRDGQALETKRFLYTFKKPMHVRMDIELPYTGMVLVYPDENGKVTVKPGGLFPVVRLHLSPDSALFVTSTGQRIDQTDLCLLIRNIGHSLTDSRRGETKTFEHDGMIHIKVLARDHFLGSLPRRG